MVETPEPAESQADLCSSWSVHGEQVGDQQPEQEDNYHLILGVLIFFAIIIWILFMVT